MSVDYSDIKVALWYWRHFQPCVQLYENEEVAAIFALSIVEDGQGYVSGIQLAPDGRWVSLEDWVAFKVEEKRREQKYEEVMHNYVPEPTYKILPPDEIEAKGKLTEVVSGTPSWVGKATE